jgi:SUMO ligase MMS21 Smc5/6 complex component
LDGAMSEINYDKMFSLLSSDGAMSKINHDKIQSVLRYLHDLNYHMRTTINQEMISDFRSNVAKLDSLLNCVVLEHRDDWRSELLVSAKILTEDGHYHPDFFTEETVNKSKES